jgi:HEAT repeat protein
MLHLTQRNLDELLGAYRAYLLSKVSRVRILGEADERELKDVFVELSIVDRFAPQQHAEFLGMMDFAMRRRFNPFASVNRDISFELTERRVKGVKRRVKLGDLLRLRTKSIITGAPGCGKTTLLKYLALRAQGEEQRLAVWLELKAIDKSLFAEAEKAAARGGKLILQELWLMHMRTQLMLTDAEVGILREYWQEKFRANEIAVLLDGFDELQDESVELSLNKCIREFASAAHDNTLLISTRPYAQHKLGKERLQELEIEPLNQSQIQAFLNCYYPDNAAAKNLLNSFQERSSLRELLHVPLLLGVILRLHRENRYTDERLKLYETVIADLVHELDRSKSVTRRFKINDERLRFDFLKSLAFERLLHDPLDEDEKEANRIVFNYDLLKDKARSFLERESTSYNPRDLANDALATPLLREVGADAFAFTHLTLQEYLAARAFADFHKRSEFEGLKIFCRAYHNPVIVEMEVLPMILGATPIADNLYDSIGKFSDSVDFIGLRLRLRGLSYNAKISLATRGKIVDELEELLVEKQISDTPYCDLVMNSLYGIHGDIESYIVDRLASLLRDQNNSVRWRAARALGAMRSRSALQPLIDSFSDSSEYVRANVAEALGYIGGEQAASKLLEALGDENPFVRSNVAKALGNIKSIDAVEPLIHALTAESDNYVRGGITDALGELGDERAVEILSLEFTRNKEESWHAAESLVKIGERGIAELLRFVIGNDHQIRWDAFTTLPDNLPPMELEALGDFELEEPLLTGTPYNCLTVIGESAAVQEILILGKKVVMGQIMEHDATAAMRESPVVVPGLLKALQHHDSYVRSSAAEALGIVEDQRAVEPLIKALRDEDSTVREKAVEALGAIKPPFACDALVDALDDPAEDVRKQAAMAVGTICKGRSDKVIDKLTVLTDNNESNNLIRWNSITSLGQLGGKKAAFILLVVLLFNRISVDRERAIQSLSLIEDCDLRSALEAALYQTNALLKSKAAQVIGYCSIDRRVLERLTELARADEDMGVREVAKEAAAKFTRKLELLGYFITENTAQPLSDNESREGVLIGEVTKTVFGAGHIFRPTPNNDWGIDGEIEFKNDKGEASGRRVYLQLKSGDSYLYQRKADGKEIFTMKNPRHAEYWQAQAYPVLLVIRDSSGQIRWMNVTEYLQRHGTGTTQIDFQGEPFNEESVKQMRTRFIP